MLIDILKSNIYIFIKNCNRVKGSFFHVLSRSIHSSVPTGATDSFPASKSQKVLELSWRQETSTMDSASSGTRPYLGIVL